MAIASIDVVFIVILIALVANGTSKGFIALFLGKAAFWVRFWHSYYCLLSPM